MILANMISTLLRKNEALARNKDLPIFKKYGNILNTVIYSKEAFTSLEIRLEMMDLELVNTQQRNGIKYK